MRAAKRVASVAAVSSLAAYSYDTLVGGSLINRSARCLKAAGATYVDYKTMTAETPEELSALHARVAERWLDVCVRNAGLYVKLGQQVASMNHVLPKEYLRTFSKLHDDAPKVSYGEIERTIKEEFNGKTIAQVFATFDPVPVASASIAQVHKATTLEGDLVAVKIQKPEIPIQMETDLFMYWFLGNAFEWAFDLPIAWTIPYSMEQIRKELDFEIEVENSRRCLSLARLDSRNDSVVVPKVFDTYSTKKVMTAEWIEGVKIDRASEIGASPREVAKTIIEFFSSQLFLTGSLHCDPHPGNLLIRQDPSNPSKTQIVVLDHGLTVHLPDAFREQYARFWRAIILGDKDEMLEIAEAWGVGDHELFASFQIFRPVHGNKIKRKVEKRDVAKLQARVKARIQKLLKDTSSTPPELALVGRHLNLVRSLNKSLASPVNRIDVMARYANEGAGANRKSDQVRGGRSFLSELSTDVDFRLRLWAIDVMFALTEAYRSWAEYFSGRKVDGVEEILDKRMNQDVQEKLGIDIDPENVG